MDSPILRLQSICAGGWGGLQVNYYWKSSEINCVVDRCSSFGLDVLGHYVDPGHLAVLGDRVVLVHYAAVHNHYGGRGCHGHSRVA